MTAMCGLEGCPLPVKTMGYCNTHYARFRRNGHVQLLPPKPRPDIATRLAQGVDRSAGPDGCWPWRGSKTNAGYGRIGSDEDPRRTFAVHRVAYQLANPEAPEPEALDHICHVPSECRGGSTCPHRSCCNPAHVVPTTRKENSAAGRQWTRRFEDTCARGHVFDEANTYWHRDQRHCRACRIERRHQQQAARRSEVA